MERERLIETGADPNLFSDLQLKNVLFDFWVAGQETTSTTLTWGIAYILHNLHTQERAQAELDKVVGSKRLITMADKPNLPYMNAMVMVSKEKFLGQSISFANNFHWTQWKFVVKLIDLPNKNCFLQFTIFQEIQRRSNLITENVWRSAANDYECEEFKLKKGQLCVFQFSALFENPELFPEPKAFKPERFLDENGNVKRCDELAPFSIGKRACLGEGLARMELFLLTANLLNRFKVRKF